MVRINVHWHLLRRSNGLLQHTPVRDVLGDHQRRAHTTRRSLPDPEELAANPSRSRSRSRSRSSSCGSHRSQSPSIDPPSDVDNRNNRSAHQSPEPGSPPVDSVFGTPPADSIFGTNTRHSNASSRRHSAPSRRRHSTSSQRRHSASTSRSRSARTSKIGRKRSRARATDEDEDEGDGDGQGQGDEDEDGEDLNDKEVMKKLPENVKMVIRHARPIYWSELTLVGYVPTDHDSLRVAQEAFNTAKEVIRKTDPEIDLSEGACVAHFTSTISAQF